MRTLIAFGMAVYSISALSGCRLLDNPRSDKQVAGRKSAAPVVVKQEIKAAPPAMGIAARSTPLSPDAILTPPNQFPIPKPLEPVPVKGDLTARKKEIAVEDPSLPQPRSRGVNELPAAARARPSELSMELPVAPKLPAVEPKVTVPALPSLPDLLPPPSSPAPEKKKAESIEETEIPLGQSDDFKSITGKVESYRKTWRLRYADISEEDAFGGVVVLDGDLGKIRDGCHVRVTGTLAPAVLRTESAIYRVKTIEILD
jgi:hypothetical protein